MTQAGGVGRRLTGLGPADLLRALHWAHHIRASDEADEAFGRRCQRWAALQGYHPKEEVDANGAQRTQVREPAVADEEAGEPVVESVDVAGAATPPLQTTFFALTQLRNLKDQDDPATDAKGVQSETQEFTRAMCLPQDPAPSHRPLVRSTKLWPAVRRSMALHWEAGVDVQRLSRDLARAQLPVRLPRRHESGGPGTVQVVWDRADHLWPYNEDYRQLLNLLHRLQGAAGVQAWQVDALPVQGVARLQRCTGAAGRDGEWEPVPAGGQVVGGTRARAADALEPRAGATVLVLGDAGSLAADAAASRQWALWLARLQQRGCHVVLWTPCGPGWVAPALTRRARVHCLLAGTGGGAAGAEPLRRRSGGTAEQAWRAQQRAVLLERLFTRAAICLHLGPDLLRRLRQGDPLLAREPAVESWAWSAGSAVRRSGVSRALTGAARADYLARFAQLPAQEQLALLACVQEGHRHLGRSTSVVEALCWKAHAQPAAAAAEKVHTPAAETWLEAYVAKLDAEAVSGSPNRSQPLYANDVLARVGDDARLMAAQPAWASRLVLTAGQRAVPAGVSAEALAAASRAMAPRQETMLQLWPHERNHELVLAASGTTVPKYLLHPELHVEARHCLVTRADGSREFLSRPTWEVGLARRGQPCQQIRLRSDRAEFTFAELSRPDWAVEWGRDKFGLFATLEVAGTPQRLRYLPPGRFLMGSPVGESGHIRDEGPQHEVTLTRGFWLADTCCTQALWLAVMGGENPSQVIGDPTLPVDDVDLLDVNTFLGRLQRQLPSGVEAVLPTEAQWEYACRAGTQTPFSFGETLAPELANLDMSLGRTVQVKSLPANPWGLFEMHGNLWEWCADARRRYVAEPVEDPDGGRSYGYYRARRGGAWYDVASFARSASRNHDPRDKRIGFIGFRFALRTVEPGAGGTTGTGRAEPGAGVGPAEPGPRAEGIWSRVTGLFKGRK